METYGTLGYIIGRKKRMMYVYYDVDLLWQVLVREIYVLMKHYGSTEALKTAFDAIKITKGNPKISDINKLQIFSDLNETNESNKNWENLLRYCHGSFINILESGYVLNQKNEKGTVFLLDFNKNCVIFYDNKTVTKMNNIEYNSAKIEEIMEFNDMPTKTLTEIITEMNERFQKSYKKIIIVDNEIKKIKEIINKTKEMGGEQNIIQKANILLDNMDWERKKIIIDYRFFYYRLDSLNLINYDEK